MKILEIRIEFPDNPSNEDLNELGENMQLQLPIDLEAIDFRTGDITFEVKEVKDN